MTETGLLQGANSWNDFRSARGGYTFVWQDLDGLHWTSELPVQPPYTSLLHGWSDDGRTLVRVRLDGARLWEAQLNTGNNARMTVVEPLPWGAKTRRVAGFRPAAGNAEGVSLDQTLAQVEVTDVGEGALVFLVPPALLEVWQ